MIPNSLGSGTVLGLRNKYSHKFWRFSRNSWWNVFGIQIIFVKLWNLILGNPKELWKFGKKSWIQKEFLVLKPSDFQGAYKSRHFATNRNILATKRNSGFVCFLFFFPNFLFSVWPPPDFCGIVPPKPLQDLLRWTRAGHPVSWKPEFSFWIFRIVEYGCFQKRVFPKSSILKGFPW